MDPRSEATLLMQAMHKGSRSHEDIEDIEGENGEAEVESDLKVKAKAKPKSAKPKKEANRAPRPVIGEWIDPKKATLETELSTWLFLTASTEQAWNIKILVRLKSL